MLNRDCFSGCFDICAISLQPHQNAGIHFTDNYTWQSNRKLVARRGFAVQLTLTCTEAYENQPVILQFDLDNGNASNDRETQRQVRLDCQQKPSKANKDDVIYWEIKELKFEENFIHIELLIPHDEIIGCWRLKIYIGFNNDRRESYVSSQQRIKIYIIFNPFCVKDDAYLDQRYLRDYYLNQENDLWFSGIAVGSDNNYYFRKEPWNHGQFEEKTMKTVSLLLERLSLWNKQRFRGGLSYPDRRSVVRLARKLSFGINYILLHPADETNQSSTSSLNTSFNDWMSTSEIIDEFIQIRQPVPCVSSHIYGNVFVSILRTIGVCARVCTCIESVHDTDMLLTVDRAYFRESETFMPMKRNENFEWESNWNWTIWTELYCKRLDLNGDYGGWQAVDATAIGEHNMTSSQCGPVIVSIWTIKEGRLDLIYDIWYFYGQLNSNVVKWFYDKNPETSEFHLVKTDFDQKSKGIGRAVLTSNPRSFGYPMDLTNEYKQEFDEECSNRVRSLKSTGLMERKERIQLLHTNKSVNQQRSNIEFKVKEIGFVTYGDDINVEVEFNNKADSSRCISFSVRVYAQQPNGRLTAQINNFQDRIKLNPYESESLKLFTPISDYSKYTTNYNSLIAIISASVEGFSDLFYHEEKFKISGSAIVIVCQSIGQINEPLIGIITVRNPLPETLTNVELFLHNGKSSHASKIERFPREIHPGQRVKLQIRFCPTQPGYRFLVAVVHSTQIKNLQAVHLFRSVEPH